MADDSTDETRARNYVPPREEIRSAPREPEMRFTPQEPEVEYSQHTTFGNY
jgi:hypothetical protein